MINDARQLEGIAMSDEHLPKPQSGRKIAQLDFFDLLDSNDDAYSQARENIWLGLASRAYGS